MNSGWKISVSTGLVACLIAATSFADFAVIGNPHLPFNHLTKNQIKRLFLNQSTGIDTNVQLQAYNQPDESPAYKDFYRSVFDWSPAQVTSYWSSYMFQGLGSPPPNVSDDENAIAVVEGTSGAISYIDASALSMAQGNVKILYQVGGNNIKSNVPMKKTVKSVQKPATKKKVTPKKPVKKSFVSEKVDATAMQAQKEIAAINASLHSNKAKPKPKAKSVEKPQTATSLWPVLTKSFTFQSNANVPEVRQQISWYLKNKTQLLNAIEQAKPYLYFLYQQTQAQHVPAELALYPLVVNGFEDKVHGDNAGLWQLNSISAFSMGLKINPQYDARLNPSVSTQAVFTNLKNLQNNFNDWLVTLAAFKVGIAPVHNALQASKTKDFWALKLDPRVKLEVARLVALTQIIKFPSYYDIQLPKINAVTQTLPNVAHSKEPAVIQQVKATTQPVMVSASPKLASYNTSSASLKSVLGKIYSKS